jgi:hypothetical protein
MILPGILTTLAWIMLLSPNIGLINIGDEPAIHRACTV